MSSFPFVDSGPVKSMIPSQSIGLYHFGRDWLAFGQNNQYNRYVCANIWCLSRGPGIQFTLTSLKAVREIRALMGGRWPDIHVPFTLYFGIRARKHRSQVHEYTKPKDNFALARYEIEIQVNCSSRESSKICFYFISLHFFQ